MKKILLSVLILVFCISVIPAKSYAQEFKDTDLEVKATIDGYGTSEDVTQIDNSTNYIFEINSTDLNYIDIARCSIHDLGEGALYIKASTMATTSVDILTLNVYLEKWNGSSWETISTWSKSAYLTDEIYFDTVYIGAEIGEKYRVKTIHSVNINDNEETTTTKTSYIITEQ
ncbi:hypothetical protein [Caloranaerobacter sp. DY30410]|uniref:hypothetical protein n=1 Tax=Caloranaerobacter sp. DY30410 TaxID=3238305 RepID=UPI003D050DD2